MEVFVLLLLCSTLIGMAIMRSRQAPQPQVIYVHVKEPAPHIPGCMIWMVVILAISLVLFVVSR